MKKTIRVLYLDNDLAYVKTLQGMLKKSHSSTFKIDHYLSLSDGIDQLHSTVFDLVLMDLDLPDSKWFSAFNRLRRYVTNAPIVILTGLDDVKLALKTVKAGAQDYLVKKDINSNTLIRALLRS